MEKQTNKNNKTNNNYKNPMAVKCEKSSSR